MAPRRCCQRTGAMLPWRHGGATNARWRCCQPHRCGATMAARRRPADRRDATMVARRCCQRTRAMLPWRHGGDADARWCRTAAASPTGAVLPWRHGGAAKPTRRCYQGMAVLLSWWQAVVLPAAYVNATMGICRCYDRQMSLLPATGGGACVFSGDGGGGAGVFLDDGGSAAMGREMKLLGGG